MAARSYSVEEIWTLVEPLLRQLMTAQRDFLFKAAVTAPDGPITEISVAACYAVTKALVSRLVADGVPDSHIDSILNLGSLFAHGMTVEHIPRGRG